MEEALTEKEFIVRACKYIDVYLDDLDRKQLDEFLTEFHKKYCEVEFIPKEND